MTREITPTEFVRRRQAGEALTLLDVREPEELAAAQVPGHVHIPMGSIPERFRELDPAGEIVVMCRAGGRSLKVAQFLEAQGYRNVANLTGGILAWSREIDPTLQP